MANIGLLLKVICQENCKNVNFRCSDKRYKDNHPAENRDKKTRVHLNVMSIYKMQRPFSVHELPLLVFERFSTTVHYSVMTQMI